MTERQVKLRKNKFLKAFPTLGLNVKKTCLHCKITRTTFYNWKKEDSNFRSALEDIEEGELDDVEESVKALAKGVAVYDKETGEFKEWKERPNLRALEALLRAKAKRRGWGDTVTVPDETPEPTYDRTQEEIMADINKMAKSMQTYDGDGVSK